MNEAMTEKIFYMPYRPVIRESSETTEKRIVCETSAKASQTSTSTSINEYLETGLRLQIMGYIQTYTTLWSHRK